MIALNRILVAAVAVVLMLFSGVALAEDEDGDDTPAVVVLAAKGVTATGAVLSGEIDPQDRETAYRFEYGETAAYGAQTPQASAGDSDLWRPVSSRVGGLKPGTTYHFRLVASSDKGSTAGEDRTFTTAATPGDPAPKPGATSPEDEPAPVVGAVEPEIGTTVAVEPAGERVRVRRPGDAAFAPLDSGSALPVGSVVDARDGHIELTAALPTGETQTGRFGGGRFVIRQGERGRVDLHLRGRYCPRRAVSQGSAVAVSARKRRGGRRLWGRDKGGRFRTHGKHSHATVRGTRWVVVDRCGGTLTRVTEGSVVVRDKVRRKRVIVRVGERYLARRR
jgi:hypothetical protein